ncbi:TPA: hypothetical protein DDZ86_02730 [Candidatus Dependentiae bacterium]|nr:hypothetical protein [Candidatus Dependentiae bacterium]
MANEWFKELQYSASRLYNEACTLIAPPYCESCRRFLDHRTPLCQECEKELEPIASIELKINSAYTLRVFALTTYTGVVRRLAIAKYYRQPLASKQLGELVARGCFCPWETFDYIVPVPLHWSRTLSRGFNQATEMAKSISKLRNIPIDYGVKRTRKTSFQAGLSSEARHSNVIKACTLSPKSSALFTNRHILIVDDVMTTGATLHETARALATSHPASITAVVGARVL